jgi:putative phage-type endonuclease
MEQLTSEWFDARRGKVTASRIADLTAKTKSGWSTSRANYMAELVAARMTGISQDSYINAAMQRGLDTEPDARTAYEFYVGSEIGSVRFIQHPTISMAGASPDGHIGTDGSVEIKCPNTNTHIETLLGGSVPQKYLYQMQWQMACSGRQWCDFVSFDPRMPEELKLYVQRVERDDVLIASLESQVIEFLAEVENKVKQLKALIEGKSPLMSSLENSLASIAVN